MPAESKHQVVSKESKQLIRHILATIAYRLAKSVHHAEPSFYLMESGNGVRRPKEILRHMSQVITFTLATLEKRAPDKLEQLDGDAELKRFYLLLNNLDHLIDKTDLEYGLALKLVQGPLSDTLTHIGQIAMLRRFFNDPVKGENFMNAKIRAGVIDLQEQNLSNDLFDN